MANPVEILSLAREQAGRAAALSVTLLGAPACFLTALFALALGQRGGQVWRHMGVALTFAAASRIRIGLLALAGAGLAITAWRSWRAYSEAENLTRLAARLDSELNAHQEILTFAEVIASTGAEAASARSPLFPVLWRRVSKYLASFDPAARFRINTPRLLARSALLSMVWLASLLGGLILVARLQRPPYYNDAYRLAELANEIDKTATSAQAHALARRLRAGARVLLNPNLSDKEKLIQLTALKRELEQPESNKTNVERAQREAGRAGGASAGEGSASQHAAGSGKENQGQGEGGKGAQGRGRGTQQSAGAAKKEQGLIEQARDELAKAEKQLEIGATQGQKSPTKIGENNPPSQPEQASGTGATVNPLRHGNQPVQAPGNKDGTGSQPHQTARGEATPKSGAGPQTTGAGHGDTRLGETPVSRAYARFYKPGEHGPPLGVEDARYVMVRIPAAAESGAGGKIVASEAPSKATTPYANLPLPTGSAPVNPQEQQLVPPRYRDLLR